MYDGDGNRVSKTVAGITTSYFVSNLNPTGYAQVLTETYSGGTFNPNVEFNRNYVYGLELISQKRAFLASGSNATQTSYYVYDGHGSVRALADPTGAATDSYDYDAFGNLTHPTGSTPNNYLFAGEQYDPHLHLYYNRARYLNVFTGRFWTMDTYEGQSNDPLSLHKYLYADAEPILGHDPTGETSLAELDEVEAEDAQQLQIVQTGQKGINLAKFAAAVVAGIALAAAGDNDPTQPLPLPEEKKRREEVIPLFRDADGTNPGAFGFTGGSCPFITSEISLLEVPQRNKRFTIRFTASFIPPKTTCVTTGGIIDPDLFDLGLGVVYSPTLTPGHWSLVTKSYVPTKEEQEAIKGRLAQHAKNPVNQQ